MTGGSLTEVTDEVSSSQGSVEAAGVVEAVLKFPTETGVDVKGASLVAVKDAVWLK